MPEQLSICRSAHSETVLRGWVVRYEPTHVRDAELPMRLPGIAFAEDPQQAGGIEPVHLDLRRRARGECPGQVPGVRIERGHERVQAESGVGSRCRVAVITEAR